jgi:hypothetical protein
MKLCQAIAAGVLCILLSSCSQVTERLGVGAWANRGLKPASQVAPHCRAMVEGRMSLAECLQQPESKADHGVGCMRAINDLPPRSR